MKLTLEEVKEISDSLYLLGQRDMDEWYEIAKNINLCKPKMKYYNDFKKDISEKYGDRNDEGKIVVDNFGNVVFTKHGKKVMEMISQLNSEETDISFHSININKLKNDKGGWKYKLPPSAMAPLIDKIITNGEVKKEKKESE